MGAPDRKVEIGECSESKLGGAEELSSRREPWENREIAKPRHASFPRVAPSAFLRATGWRSVIGWAGLEARPTGYAQMPANSFGIRPMLAWDFQTP